MSKSETLEVLRQQMKTLESSDCKDFYNDTEGLGHQDNSFGSTEGSYDHEEGSYDPSSQGTPKRDAYSKIIGLINASEKSVHEIRKRLKQAGYPEAEIEDAIERAMKCGLIDDSRYAHILIQSRINQGWGSAGIERELMRNGIDPSFVDGWPYDYPLSDDEQFERAFSFLERKPPHSKNIRESAYRKLVQKGYPSSIASQVARTWSGQVLHGE